MRLDTDSFIAAIDAGIRSARAPRIVEVMLMLAIALQLWSVARTATSTETSAATLTSASSPGSSSTRRRFTQLDMSQLLSAHLFGEVPAASAAAMPALAASAFKLVGLYVPKDGEAIIATDPAFASSGDGSGEVAPLEWARKFFGDQLRTAARPGAIAWLSLAGAPGQRVQVGDEIGGGKVLEIRDEGVALELAGRRVSVAYPENPYVAMFRGESDQITALVDADSIPPELASKLLRFQPSLGPAGLEGFRLYPGSDAQAFVNSGLRAGDVLEAVDGSPITSPRDLVPLLRAVRDVKPVQLRLLRASKPLDLRLFRASADTTPSSTPSRRGDALAAPPGTSRTSPQPLASITPGASSP